jgi:hypothetical protein
MASRRLTDLSGGSAVTFSLNAPLVTVYRRERNGSSGFRKAESRLRGPLLL